MTWTHDAADDFKEAYGGPPPPQYFKNLQSVVKKYGWERTRPSLRGYLKETPLKFLAIPKVLAVMIEKNGIALEAYEEIDRLDERNRLDAAEKWIECRATYGELAKAYLQWERENGSSDETEATMRRRWAKEIGAPEEIGALLSQDIYRARRA